MAYDLSSLAHAKRQEKFHREKLRDELQGLLTDVEVAIRKLDRGDRRYVGTHLANVAQQVQERAIRLDTIADLLEYMEAEAAQEEG